MLYYVQSLWKIEEQLRYNYYYNARARFRTVKTDASENLIGRAFTSDRTSVGRIRFALHRPPDIDGQQMYYRKRDPPKGDAYYIPVIIIIIIISNWTGGGGNLV